MGLAERRRPHGRLLVNARVAGALMPAMPGAGGCLPPPDFSVAKELR